MVRGRCVPEAARLVRVAVLAAAAVLVLLCAAVGCGTAERRVGDLETVRESGYLRIIVRPGFLKAPVHRLGRLDEPRLLRQLAARMGVRPVFVEAPRHDLVLQWLREGRGDVAVSRFSPQALDDSAFEATAAIAWVEDLLVAGHSTRAADEQQLDGETLGLYESASWQLDAWPELSGKVVLALVPETVRLEEVLERVRAGRYDLTISDSMMLEAARHASGLRLVSTLGPRRPLVWAVRAANPRLRVAIDHFLFAEHVLARGRAEPSCRDLAAIRAAGVLRVVMTNSSTTCTVERGGLRGFEYDLVSELARRLGVGVELAIPPPRTDPLIWLEQGYGDLACLHEPLAPGEGDRFLVTVPYRTVDLVAVTRADDPVPAGVEDLAGLTVAATRQVAAICRELPLEPPMAAAEPFTGATPATALLELARGRVDAAVIDSDTAHLELTSHSHLVAGPLVLPELPLVWITHGGAPQLFDAADGFLSLADRSGLARQIGFNYFSSWEPPQAADQPEVPDGDLTPYDEVLRWVGQQTEIDWRLLASLMYEESRFDPDAVGPGGSSGLFQLMPMTSSYLGVDDPNHPMDAARAAAGYLKGLMELFAEAPMQDRVAMAIASYNVGPRHVIDARQLAREMRLDPNRWAGNVETALLILDDPEVAQRFPAGTCRCRRAVGYTRRILRRYRAYAEQFPPA